MAKDPSDKDPNNDDVVENDAVESDEKGPRIAGLTGSAITQGAQMSRSSRNSMRTTQKSTSR